MRAVLSRTAGPPDNLVIDDIPEPTPRPGEVVIDVRACGVNFPDTLIIADRYQFKPQRPFSPGGEVSGVVSAVGPDVSGLKPGDRVLGWSNWGGMAEKLVVSQHRCVSIPASMPFDRAAALMTTYGTSSYALRSRGQLKAGEVLLVLGAAGGVGLAAVELGKAMGAHVIAAASSAEKVEVAKQRGARDGVIYRRDLSGPESPGELRDTFKRACGEHGADVIYDGVGGEYAEAALRAIAWDGRFLVVGFPAGIPKIPLNLPLLKSCQIVGVFWAAWIERDRGNFAGNARELLDLYQSGAIDPLVSERFPLARAGEAITRLATRSAVGKIVVVME